jgi:hypothetical protein
MGFSAAFEACKEKDVPDLSLPSAASKKAREKRQKERRRKEKERRRSHARSAGHSSSGSSSADSSSDMESHSDGGTGSDSDSDSDISMEKEAEILLKDNKHLKALPKSIRDLELALTANWRTISTETESFIGKPREQLENRSGVEVAVMTL